MDSSPEEVKIPILDDLRTSPEIGNRNRSRWGYIGFAASIAIVIGMFIWLVILVVTEDEKQMKLNKQPEIELNSLLVCPTNRESVIWDLKFDIRNPYNDSDICIFGGFDVCIFPYNQTKLLTKTIVTPTTCVGPRNHTSVIAFAEASSLSIEDLNDYLDPTSGTIRLDLIAFGAFSGGDLVCGDAKVALSSNNSSSSSSSSSSCGSMVGDPFTCSYRGTTSSSHFWGLFFIIGLLVILCVQALNLLSLEV